MLLQQVYMMKSSWSISNVSMEFVPRISELKTSLKYWIQNLLCHGWSPKKTPLELEKLFFYTNKYSYTISNIKLMSETITDVMKYTSCARTVYGREKKREYQLFFQSQMDWAEGWLLEG
jgi:hypothetical protein